MRIWLWVFIVGFVVSGMRAFLLGGLAGERRAGGDGASVSFSGPWDGLAGVRGSVIATAFVGLLLLDPVRNKWLFPFGLIGCAGAVALIAGAVRAIPIDWRMIDRSFGVLGCQPLLLRLSYMSWLEQMEARAIRVAV